MQMTGLIPGLGGSPGEGSGKSLQYSCLEKFMDIRALAGYSPEVSKSGQSSATKTTTNVPGLSEEKALLE